jgi:hypothetical protein
MSVDEKRIREFAYQIWESEGRPEGQEARHWEMACKLAEAEAGTTTEAAEPAKRPRRTSKAKSDAAPAPAPEAEKPGRKPRASKPKAEAESAPAKPKASRTSKTPKA